MTTPDPPDKPRDDFPLYAHRNGCWMKKVGGIALTFGGWRNDRDGSAAELEYQDYLRKLEAGVAGVARKTDTHEVNYIANLFIERQRLKAVANEVGARTFGDAKVCADRFVKIVGRTTTVREMTPARFAQYRRKLTDTMRAHASNRHMAIVRQMFRWAFKSELIPGIPNFGPDFGRFGTGVKKPKQFKPDEILAVLGAADAAMRAMVYLGINCGYGDTDCAALRFDEIDLDAGVIDTTRHKSRRSKTPIVRRCLLWPETVQAIRDYLPNRPAPADAADAPLVFLTRPGNRWVIERITPDAKGVPRLVAYSSVQLRFREFAVKAGIRAKGKGDGRSFYSLRRTFRTWADEALDKHAADLIMGHNFGSMGGQYVQGISDERLRAVSDRVRAKLLGKVKRKGATPGGGAAASSPASPRVRGRKASRPARVRA
jgi:integrase